MTTANVATNPSKSSVAIEKIQFHGDEPEAAKTPDGKVWVSIRRVCEGLGVAIEGQLRRLKSKPWATMIILIMVAEDGKSRETSCLELRSLPMWLATVDARRVRPEVRAKLTVYQTECHDVLARHFLGQSNYKSDPVRTASLVHALARFQKAIHAIQFKNLEARAFMTVARRAMPDNEALTEDEDRELMEQAKYVLFKAEEMMDEMTKEFTAAEGIKDEAFRLARVQGWVA